MTLHRLILVSFISIVMAAVPSMHADTVGSAFTYQGVLSDAGAPVEGNYDFRVFLYNADVGGGQVGTTVLVGNVTVTDGRVTLDLDFGNVFYGTALWLEIHLRETGTTTYTPLWPRQRLMATPFANHAAEADAAASALWADDSGSAVSAADADQLGGQSPTYYLEWSNITGVPTDLSNGDDDTLAGLSCAAGEIAKWSGSIWTCGDDAGGLSSTYIVGPVGTDTENGAALLAAVAALPTATETTPILVQVEPGTYDLGTTSLVLPDWVSLEGAGQGLTTITSAVGTYSGTINVGSRSELRAVTALNTCADPGQDSVAVATSYLAYVSNITAISDGNANYNRALRNTGGWVTIEHAHLEVINGTGASRKALTNSTGNFTLRNVDVIVSGGTDWLYAIHSDGSGFFVAENVTVSATGATSNTFGIYTLATDVRLNNVTIETESTGQSIGLYTSGGGTTMKNVKTTNTEAAATANYGLWLKSINGLTSLDQVDTSSTNYGLYLENGGASITIRNSHFSSGTTGVRTGSGLSSPVTIHHSILQKGTGYGVSHSGTGTVTIAASQVEGTSGAGTLVCTGVWDGSHTFYPSTCP